MQPLTILFDLDGTLVDSAPDLIASMNFALSQKDLPIADFDLIRPIVGKGAKAMISAALKSHNLDQDAKLVDGLWHILLDHYRIHIADQSRAFEGAIDCLSHLSKNGYGLGVVTNKSQSLAETVLAELNLDHFFQAISGADRFAFKKPDPRHLLETAKLVGAGPNIIMVGDSEADITAAKAGNVPVIAVAWGYSDLSLETFEPTELISNFDQLIPAITAVAQSNFK